MTALRLPDVRRWESWAACVEEFGDGHIDGAGAWNLPAGRFEPTWAGCAAAVPVLLALADPVAAGPDRVPSDYWWITDGEPDGPDTSDGAPDDVVGFLAVRHRLNDFLLEEGGHIGYAVRPSRRRQGHASRALALGVRRAAELGVDRVLVTCDDDNLASAATIERNHGVLEDVRRGKRRYWIAATDPL